MPPSKGRAGIDKGNPTTVQTHTPLPLSSSTPPALFLLTLFDRKRLATGPIRKNANVKGYRLVRFENISNLLHLPTIAGS